MSKVRTELINARGEYWCGGCKQYHREAIKGAHRTLPDGTFRQYYLCHGCARKRTKAAYRKNPKKFAAMVLRSEARNPARRQAYGKVAYALRTGVLIKPARCEKCPETYRLQAHHRDYAKPLDIIWLCSRCHAKEDLEIISISE